MTPSPAPVAAAPALSRHLLLHLRAIAAGETIGDTAKRLHVSENTVKTHRAKLYGALEVGTAAEAVAVAYHLGILDPAVDPRRVEWPVGRFARGIQ